MTRQQKSERQRAEEALGIAARKVRRLTTERDRLAKALNVIQQDLQEAQRLETYRAAHPALQSTTPTTTQENA